MYLQTYIPKSNLNIHKLFVKAKMCEQPKSPSTVERISSMWSICATENYSALKERGIRNMLQRGWTREHCSEK